MAYDPTTDVGKVRMLIPDRVESEYVFNDAEIGVFLELEDGIIKRATALALETISTDEALVQKVQKTLGLETNGAATAKVLLQRAATMREQAKVYEDDDDEDMFDIAEVVNDQFSAREQIWTSI